MWKYATSDFKSPGDRIYLVGESLNELGASEVSFMLENGTCDGIGGTVPNLSTLKNYLSRIVR